MSNKNKFFVKNGIAYKTINNSVYKIKPKPNIKTPPPTPEEIIAECKKTDKLKRLEKKLPWARYIVLTPSDRTEKQYREAKSIIKKYEELSK